MKTTSACYGHEKISFNILSIEKGNSMISFIIVLNVTPQRIKQGIDGSARKPALIQDTGYMVEKTYHDIAPYLRAFGAYLMPQ